MAAINFSLNVVEQGTNDGNDAYIVTLIQNPTTIASGGTTLATFTGVGTNQSMAELIEQASGWARSVIAAANQNDSLN